MNEQEFLDELAKCKDKYPWKLMRADFKDTDLCYYFIRADIPNKGDLPPICPICVVCYDKTGIIYDSTEHEQASIQLGIDLPLDFKIINAADDGVEIELRGKLLKVLGL